MDEFISKVEMILDSPKLRNQVVEKLKPRLNKMKWRQQILSTCQKKTGMSFSQNKKSNVKIHPGFGC